jgi:hypothetical protein
VQSRFERAQELERAGRRVNRGCDELDLFVEVAEKHFVPGWRRALKALIRSAVALNTA